VGLKRAVAGGSAAGNTAASNASEEHSKPRESSLLGLWRPSPQLLSVSINNRQHHHSITYEQPTNRTDTHTPAIERRWVRIERDRIVICPVVEYHQMALLKSF